MLFVSANLIRGTTLASDPTKDTTFIKPYRILEKSLTDGAGQNHRVKIGFVPPQIMQWDEANLAGKVITRDIVQTAQAWVPQMQEAGCDLIVALSNTGIEPAISQHEKRQQQHPGASSGSREFQRPDSTA